MLCIMRMESDRCIDKIVLFRERIPAGIARQIRADGDERLKPGIPRTPDHRIPVVIELIHLKMAMRVDQRYFRV